MGLGEFGRFDHLGGRCVGITHGDVVHDGSLHEKRLLKDHADLAAEGVEFDLGEIEPVDFHFTLHRFVESPDDFEKGALSRSAQADHGDEFSSWHLKRDVFELEFSRGIAEVEILTGDSPLDLRHWDLLVRVLILARSVGDISETIH